MSTDRDRVIMYRLGNSTPVSLLSYIVVVVVAVAIVPLLILDCFFVLFTVCLAGA